ncbi:MAG: glycosyltransferase family 39 protein [Gammaproteobacteria bacterium]|nr:glycosyltransferase family 39 protein [Gammaproteobacteria bacterium]
MLNSARFSWFLFVMSVFLFVCGLSQHELTQFETRFGYFAQTIAWQGFSFFPVLYGHPYPDYPATYPFLIYLSSLIFGKVTLFSAVWPSALHAAGTVVLTYRLGALQKTSWGIAAVLFELGTFYFVMTARSVSLDQLVLFVTTLSFYLVYLAQYSGETCYRKWLPWVLLYGFMCRGPMGMVIPLSVVLMFDLLNADYRRLMKTLLMGMLLFLMANVCLLLLAYQTGGRDFVLQVLEMQGLGRIQKLGHYPFYFYFQQAWSNYAVTFPLACIVVAVLHRQIFRKHASADMKFIQYMVAWAGIILLGLSIPTEKKLRYILPITPAISLISARLILDNSSWLLAQIRSVLLIACAIFPWLGLFLTALLYGFGVYKQIELGASYVWAVLFLLFILLAGRHSLRLWKEKIIRYQIKLGMGVGAFLVMIICLVQPVHAYFNRTQPFAQQLDQHHLPGQKIVFYKIGPDAEDVKLMVALNEPTAPFFVNTPPALLALPSKTLVVAREEDYDALPESIKLHFSALYYGKIGHQKAILLIAAKRGRDEQLPIK